MQTVLAHPFRVPRYMGASYLENVLNTRMWKVLVVVLQIFSLPQLAQRAAIDR